MTGKVIVIMGPTAIGKTSLSIRLAKKFNAEIISTDSVMVYKHFNIGSSKPTLSERNGVIHHLIDICNPIDNYSAGQFCLDALNILQPDKNYILIGGTMMYAHHFLKHQNTQPSSNIDVRNQLIKRLNSEGLDQLWSELINIDHRYQGKISKNDTQRILRAIEVYQSTGQSLLDHWDNQSKSAHENSLVIKMIPKDRDHHKSIIYQRLNQMIEQGFIEEVQHIKSMPLSENFNGLKSIGYREISQHIDGLLSKKECIELANISTRQYAKRQLTWMRNQNYKNELIFEHDTSKELNFLYINKVLDKYFSTE